MKILVPYFSEYPEMTSVADRDFMIPNLFAVQNYHREFLSMCCPIFGSRLCEKSTLSILMGNNCTTSEILLIIVEKRNLKFLTYLTFGFFKNSNQI